VLSVLSLNVWNYDGPWEQRLALIRQWIRLLDPDLIGMQEILQGPEFSQADSIFEGFEYHLDFEPMMDFWTDPSLKIGNLVASRWPISDREAVALPQEGKADRRVLLSVDVDSPHGRLCFNTTHLNATVPHGWIREKQVIAVGDAVIRRRPRNGFPLILCGDFNARPDSSEIRYMKGLQAIGERSLFLYDAWEAGGDGTAGYTFSPRNNYLRESRMGDLRLDYIFTGERLANGSGRILRCHLVCDVPHRGVFPSDHFGLYAELATADDGAK
jgi:endonuclease/exonuclease/phosphatase family metal-dependent hydrolase